MEKETETQGTMGKSIDFQEYINKRAIDFKQEESVLEDVTDIDYIAAFRHMIGIHTDRMTDIYDAEMARRYRAVNGKIQESLQCKDPAGVIAIDEDEDNALAACVGKSKETEESRTSVIPFRGREQKGAQ